MAVNWTYTARQVRLMNNMDRVRAKAWVASEWLRDLFGHDTMQRLTDRMCADAMKSLPALVELTKIHGPSIDPGEEAEATNE